MIIKYTTTELIEAMKRGAAALRKNNSWMDLQAVDVLEHEIKTLEIFLHVPSTTACDADGGLDCDIEDEVEE